MFSLGSIVGSDGASGVGDVGMKTVLSAVTAGAAIAVVGGAVAVTTAANAAVAVEPSAGVLPVATVTYTPYPEDPVGFADLAEIGIAVGQEWESDWGDVISIGPASGDLTDLSVLVIRYVEGIGAAPSPTDLDEVADRFDVEFELHAGSYWG